MTPAEFKTLRESLWLSQQDIADLADVQKRTVQYWEKGASVRGIPGDVTDHIKRLDALVESAVLNVVDFIGDKASKPTEIVLLRYLSENDLKRYRPLEHEGFGSVKVHSAMIDRTRAALGRLGVKARITYMEPDRYEEWRHCEGLSDGEDTRSVWAGLQID